MKTSSWLTRLSVLSLSLIIISNASNAAALPQIQEAFPGQSVTAIEMISMLPTLMVSLFVILAIPLSKKISARTQISLGLILAFIGGIGPAFAPDFTWILILRALFGAGIGLYNSYAITLINEMYSGPEQTRMLGYQNAVQGGGAALLTFAAGQLLIFGWRATFAIYLIIPLMLAAFWLFVPAIKKQAPNKEAETSSASAQKSTGNSKKSSLASGVLFCTITIFLILLFYNVLYLKLVPLVINQQIGDGAAGANLLTIVQIFSLISGLIFGWLFARLKKNLLWIGCLIVAVCFFLISSTSSYWILMVCCALCGLACGSLIPYFFNEAAALSKPWQMSLSNTLLLIGAQMAGFVCPYLMILFSRGWMSDPNQNCFLWSATAFILLGFFLLVYGYHQKENQN